MRDFSQSIRRACRELEKGQSNEEESDNLSSYSLKIRESCRRHIQGDDSISEENDDSPLKSKRHKKFALAKLDLELLRSKSKKKLRTINNLNIGPTQTLVVDIEFGPPNSSRSGVSTAQINLDTNPKLKSIIKATGKASGIKNQVKFTPETLLWDASIEGDIESLKKATKSVININHPNYAGVTALHNAASSSSLECVKYLVECGADVNSTDELGWSALHYAAYYGDFEICKYLIENGANVHLLTTREGYTALMVCKGVKSSKKCEKLLSEFQNNIGIINGGVVYATFEYEQQNGDEISFKAGEKLVIIKRGDENEQNWWMAENVKGIQGYVPCTLLSSYESNIKQNTE